MIMFSNIETKLILGFWLLIGAQNVRILVCMSVIPDIMLKRALKEFFMKRFTVYQVKTDRPKIDL